MHGRLLESRFSFKAGNIVEGQYLYWVLDEC
jgi:hypothetical protein